jgi:hypothetical protein
MPHALEVAAAFNSRSRAVFVHSRGSRLFLGPAPERVERELAPKEVEALASAGFEIVEVNMREGTPLCATLASLPSSTVVPIRVAGWRDGDWTPLDA